MGAYLVSRLLHSALVVLGVSVVVFGLTYLGGDPAATIAPISASQEDIERIRRDLGFDQPLPVQYLRFLAGAIRGDFGTSLRHNQPALPLVLERLPATLELTGAALLLSALIAVPLGIVTAVRRNSPLDLAGTVAVLAGQSVPTFWLGVMLIIVFAVDLKVLPASGRGDWRNLVLPAVALGAYSAAITARLLRSSLIEVLAADYIRTARAKGLAPRVVLLGHALRNAALPVVTVLGLQLGALLGGAVVTETVFAYPGMGRLAIQSISNRDVPVVQAFVFVTALLIALINLGVDLLYAALDPRIQLRGGTR